MAVEQGLEGVVPAMGAAYFFQHKTVVFAEQ
jgi:hypothetical protein